jgi:hypothetical protein
VFVSTTSYDASGWHRGTARLDLRSGRLDPVLADGQCCWLLPSGHLLFVRGQTLFAARYDRGAGTIRGDAVPLLDGIRARGAWIPGAFALTRSGDLLYAAGGLVGDRRELGIFGLDGKFTALSSEHRAFQTIVRATRDGRWVIAPATNARGIDELMRLDAADGSIQRLVAIPDADITAGPITADQSQVLFTRYGAGNANGIYVVPMSGDQDPRPVYLDPNGRDDTLPYALELVSGGTRILGAVAGANNGAEVKSYAYGSTPVGPKDLKATLPGWSLQFLRVSWDGRWMAFTSDHSGVVQVYVSPLGADGTAGTPVRVARSGLQAGWSADASRLFVLDSTRVKAVPMSGGAPTGPPQTLYDIGRLAERMGQPAFLPDGRVVAMLRPQDEQELTRIEVIQGWVASIRAKLPR